MSSAVFPMNVRYVLQIDTSQLDKDVAEMYASQIQKYVATPYHERDSGFDLYIPCGGSFLEKSFSNKINHKVRIRVLEIRDNAYAGMGYQPNITRREKHVGYYLYPRSSISKSQLRMSNSVGIIDASYRGNLIAMVDNHGEVKHLERGERLFQVCNGDLSPFDDIEICDISTSETKRGAGGFGSTGK
jgi:hypothetical protein